LTGKQGHDWKFKKVRSPCSVFYSERDLMSTFFRQLQENGIVSSLYQPPLRYSRAIADASDGANVEFAGEPVLALRFLTYGEGAIHPKTL
jgi:hypothetical protein